MSAMTTERLTEIRAQCAVAQEQDAESFAWDALKMIDELVVEVEALERSLDGRTRSLQEVVEAKDRLVEMYEAKLVDGKQTIHIVFDGPPGPEPGRFVEVEDAEGHGINVGEWKEREDGYCVLVLDVVAGEGR